MFTRGYTFHTYDHGKNRNTYNYGVYVKGASCSPNDAPLPDFYGTLQQILEVEYPGMVGLKVMLFKCKWFDPTIGRGTRKNRWGGVDVCNGRSYAKYDPFILASQGDQVCFVPYPTIKRKKEDWMAAVRIEPRGVLTLSGDTVEELFQGGSEEAILPIQIAAEDVSGQAGCLANADVEGEDVDDIEDVSHDEFHTSGDKDSIEYDTESGGDSL